jgi:NAD(P)-dependent dehydrogenase (short-subunit alcohol dehydrogenase family)
MWRKIWHKGRPRGPLPTILTGKTMIISDSVFLITGGSSGLGAATARMALDAGARVVLADLAEPRGGLFTPADAEGMAYVRTDVADEAQGQAAVDTALQRFGRLDVLVNAAGVGPAEKIFGKSGPHRLESFARTIQINLVGTFNMMRLAVPAMARSGATGAQPDASASQGVIVNTASVAAFDGQIGQAAYAASKGGVVAMTLPAARELARERIRVMTIAPGIFETPMLLGLPQEVQDSLGRSVPHPARLGRPAEYAALVRSIVENEYLNGEVIRLDGAIRMAAK